MLVRGRPGRINFMCTHRVVLASFVFLLCLFSALVRTAGCLSPSPSLVLAEALHVGFFFFSSLVIHILLLLSSCVSSWKDCACRGKLSSSDTWHCFSVLTNLVGPPLAGVTLQLEDPRQPCVPVDLPVRRIDQNTCAYVKLSSVF